jgi:integrase
MRRAWLSKCQDAGSSHSAGRRLTPSAPCRFPLRLRHDSRSSSSTSAPTLGLLFTSSNGYPIRHRNFLRRVWYPTVTELGLPLVGLHVLRHSAAARMIGAGWSAKAVQSTLGHASASFTLTVYGHLFDSDMDELAAALESVPRRTGDVRAATTH